MRILQVNTYHYRRGGDCVHALALGDALARAGHDVRWFGMRHPANLPSSDASHWLPYLDFAELNDSRSPGAAVAVLGRAIYSREAAARLGGMLDEWAPDVAHLHSIHGHLSLSVLVELSRRGIPIVWTLHDYKLLCPNTQLMSRGEVCERCAGRRFWQCVRRRCKKGSLPASMVAWMEAEAGTRIDPSRRVARFIAPSRFLVEKFGESGWDTSRFVHLPNFAPAPAVSRVPSHDAARFAYIGRLDPAKGVHTLVAAVGAVPQATLDIAGDGPLAAELRAHAEQAAPGRVTFHGRLDGVRLEAIRDAASAVVVPSEWYENSPYSVIEALCRGVPVIAADIGGLPELVVPRENGLLFAPGDTRALALALRTLAEDEGLRERLSQGALRSAGGLGVDDYLPRLMGVYDAVA